jgi:hypothetical protein
MTRAGAALAAALLAAMTGCVSIPDTYAPPEQRKPLSLDEPSGLKSFIRLNEASAPIHFVRDVRKNLEGGTWRWTAQKPTLMFNLTSTKDKHLVVDFAVPDIVFSKTGPVDISFRVNGHLLDKIHYDKPGSQHYDKAVPPEWLRVNVENIVEMEIDKVWVSPEDQVTLGFVLTSVGFLP